MDLPFVPILDYPVPPVGVELVQNLTTLTPAEDLQMIDVPQISLSNGVVRASVSGAAGGQTTLAEVPATAFGCWSPSLLQHRFLRGRVQDLSSEERLAHLNSALLRELRRRDGGPVSRGKGFG